MRAFLATPELCLPPAALGRLPRQIIEAAVDRLIAELDRRDGDPDLEPSEGDLDHLGDDDTVHRLDALPLPASNLFALEGHRHVA